MMTATASIVDIPDAFYNCNHRLPFPLALYEMLDDADTYDFSNIISWNEDASNTSINVSNYVVDADTADENLTWTKITSGDNITFSWNHRGCQDKIYYYS